MTTLETDYLSLEPAFLDSVLERIMPASSLYSAKPAHRLLVLCHDDIDQIDRRILLQTKVWRDRGYEVVIVCVTSRGDQNVERILPNGEMAVAFAIGSMKSFCDPLWAPDVQVSQENNYSRLYVRLWRVRRLIMQARERLFRFGRHHRRFIAPFLRRLRLSPRVLGSWYPMPFTASLIECGASYPSSVVLSCDLPSVPAGAWLARAWGAAFLYDSHELYPEQVSYDSNQKFVLKAWENWGIRQTALTYTVSTNIAKRMAVYYPGIPEPFVITNAASFPPLTESVTVHNPLRHAAGISDSDFVFIYHGGFSPHRNLETMIEGFAKAQLPNTHLVLMGYGDTDLVARVAQRTGSHNVHILPAVPQAVLGQWVKGANMVVIPYPAVDENTRLGSPNKMYDCIEIDMPMMANQDMVTVAEVFEKYGIGYSVPMDSVDAMSQSFKSLRRAHPVDAVRFAHARKDLGWTAQAVTINLWIDQIENSGTGVFKVAAF